MHQCVGVHNIAALQNAAEAGQAETHDSFGVDDDAVRPDVAACQAGPMDGLQSERQLLDDAPHVGYGQQWADLQALHVAAVADGTVVAGKRIVECESRWPRKIHGLQRQRMGMQLGDEDDG